MPGTFDILMLLARPAAGKSETMQYLKHMPLEERMRRFHIGKIDEIDDFPMLWAWFEEDDLLQEMGFPRLHSTPDGYFTQQHLWDVLIRRICLEYQKHRRDYVASGEPVTALVEFARGVEHGGWKSAFRHISPLVAGRAAILYIDVPFEESLRKNRRRFNPEKPDSILEHGLSDEKMKRLYRDDDWAAVAPGESGRLNVRGQSVPYVVFPNEDDVTTGKADQLAARLETVLGKLWELYKQK
jgi:hypothetical protein